MGEIKSTMDIIMEKTKNLTMTDEERKEFKERELKNRMKGLIHKFIDGFMNAERIKIELAQMPDEQQTRAENLIKAEVTERIQPGKDNRDILEIPEKVLEMDTDPIRNALEEFDKTIVLEREKIEALLKERYEKLSIGGSAVLPNVMAVPEWTLFMEKSKKEFNAKLVDLMV